MSDFPMFDRVLTPSERKRLFKTVKGSLHAAKPGTGPEGETCGSCKHLSRNRMAKTYLKCSLCRANWTGGSATDVKARDPACSKWEQVNA